MSEEYEGSYHQVPLQPEVHPRDTCGCLKAPGSYGRRGRAVPSLLGGGQAQRAQEAAVRAATLYHGHVLNVLAGLPERSIQCCVTSPPYWGLRDYKLPPQIWDGESGCAHAWGLEERGKRKDMKPTSESTSTSRVGTDERQGFGPPSGGHFCHLCGAWRGSLGLEPTVQLYVQHMVQVGRALWRVLRDDGTLWINLGDGYSHGGQDPRDAARWPKQSRSNDGDRIQHAKSADRSTKPKDLIGTPWRVALALQDDGWYLRSEIIWSKPAPMPESVRDRPTRAHEHVFLLTKSPTYFYDADAVREPDKGTDHPRNVLAGQPSLDPSGGTMAPHKGIRTVNGRNGTGRNMRTVWEIGPESCPDAHFATFPSEIPRRAILAGTSAAGCCAACGAAWVRETAVRYENPGNRSTNGPRSIERRHEKYGTAGYTVRKERRSTTTGWRPSCACGDGPVPCTVLDPFLGSGRSGVTALELGRSFVGIDLSQTYLETIARPAIEAALQAQIGEEEPPVLSVVEQGSLW